MQVARNILLEIDKQPLPLYVKVATAEMYRVIVFCGNLGSREWRRAYACNPRGFDGEQPPLLGFPYYFSFGFEHTVWVQQGTPGKAIRLLCRYREYRL